jgi:hypothetical protein
VVTAAGFSPEPQPASTVATPKANDIASEWRREARKIIETSPADTRDFVQANARARPLRGHTLGIPISTPRAC